MVQPVLAALHVMMQSSAELPGHGMHVVWPAVQIVQALLQAANYVAALEERQGLKVGAIEEVAYRMGFIDASQLERLAAEMKGNAYAQYLLSILDEDA